METKAGQLGRLPAGQRVKIEVVHEDTPPKFMASIYGFLLIFIIITSVNGQPSNSQQRGLEAWIKADG